MEKNIIEARKTYSKLINKSKQQAKKSECLWCGEKITRFCNSHSLPQCILRNIDTDGKVDYFNSMLNLPLINSDKGINEAGTFKLLCREKKKKIFQDYENLASLCVRPSETVLEEIALKNVLMMLNKRYIEIELFNNMKNEFSMPYPYEVKQEANSLDERDFWWDFIRIKDVIVKHMHICMFPLETSSVVFAFYHEEDHEYDNFANQFDELDEDEKLTVLSYIVYEYCEDMFFAKKFPHRTWIINKVKDTFSDLAEIWAFSAEHAEYQKKFQLDKLKNRDKNFPCILFEKYAVEK